MSFTVAVCGLGNIGRYTVEALQTAPDFTCLGVIRRPSSIGKNLLDLRGLNDYASIDDLVAAQGRPDAIIIASPSREVPDTAAMYLKQGFCTIDSFDIHTSITDTVKQLDAAAEEGQAVAITAAGWDPGTDSVLRALFEAMVPVGTSFTNFGRGRSMGHSVAARAIDGVADATSITIPIGGGRHSRLVYVVLKDGATLETVTASIKADPYFAHDPLEVRAVTKEQMPFVDDASHGVLLERTGASGMTSNQQLKFDMRINNPALTAQVMVSCVRAAVRMRDAGHSGAYTLIDIPPVALLPGERMDNIARLV